MSASAGAGGVKAASAAATAASSSYHDKHLQLQQGSRGFSASEELDAAAAGLDPDVPRTGTRSGPSLETPLLSRRPQRNRAVFCVLALNGPVFSVVVVRTLAFCV
jgi:hypothetical protein